MMNKQTLLLLIAILVFSFTVSGIAYAQTGGEYDLGWWTIDGGGGEVSGGGYSLNGTVGQTDAGQTLTGGGYSLTGGFWLGATNNSSSNGGHKIYLPLVLK